MSQSISYWSQTVSLPELPSLKNDLEVDVGIIGAGISGLTCAYLLLKAGKSVAILDDGPLAGGETCRTTAHLTFLLDDRFSELHRLFGLEGLKKAVDSHSQAVDLMEHICLEEKIICDFERVDGYLFRSPESPEDILETELFYAKKADLSEARLVSSPFSTFESSHALLLPHQAQFHPLKYILGLYNSILKLGGNIYKGAHVTEIKSGDKCQILTANHNIVKASSVVVATNSPINNRFVIHTKQAAYRTYVLAAEIPSDSVLKGLYYDTSDPYHYIRVYSEKNRDILIMGGEDHKTGQEKHPLERYKTLELWAKNHFPHMGRIISYWSGQIMEPIDALAFVGKNPLEKNVYVITGDSGNGLTHGTLGAALIKDIILDKASPFESLYSPERKTFKAVKEFAKENINVGAKYVEWFHPPEQIDLNKIPPGSGKVIKKEIEKVAIYKDDEGNCEMFSAICPHLGCIVSWNEAEKSWDCPCHGSRFNCKGEVLNGPALSSLKKISV